MILLASILVICACGPGHVVRTTEVDGVTLVENDGEGLWANRPDALRLVLEQTYGGDREPDEAILGRPTVMRFVGTDDGEVYVQDGQRGRLVKFRADGSVAWIAGRPGKGPGEFNAVTGVVLAPDEQAVIVSMYHGRLDYWSPDGEFLRARLIDPELGIPGVLTGYAGGVMVFREGLAWRLGARVIVAHPEAWETATSFEIDMLPGVEVMFPRPLSLRILDGMITIGNSASYEVRFYTVEGELRRRVTRDVPYPVRPARADLGGGRGMRHDFGALGAPIGLPGGYFIVPVSWEEGIIDPQATADARGSEAGWADPDNHNWRASIDLFDPEGRFLQSIASEGPIDMRGSTAFPAAIGILGNSAGLDNAGGAYLYALSPNPFPQIRRYRIELEEF